MSLKPCLNEICGGAQVGKYLSNRFPVKNGLKWDALLTLIFSSFLYYMPLGGFRITRRA
jgi:hypothetical protein